ncbi:nicotinate (nicotinamide) nucleotide adenylyltransferase [Candidimonas humi]|uniref:Probable nicotinate-nucleotide adenylyltransferase n=1 Tax=Candidimonas humi TaxID=683355 RepID=A0ABV8P623_9BURK|nr:nicotinate (nicotinamide) nucleotide adenylyltransferase [Candidimonas humi]MBV6307178.1 nicotinate (nicotinamide) nucleotide adenylyltransferase [Candidimonas humi]
MALRRIGLLGGSFDPVHLAHTALAQAACACLGLDELQLIPAADPWQRPPLAASAQQRLDMLRLAVAGQARLHVNPVEIERGGKTYTIDTLEGLPEGPEYYWILGGDQLRNFCSWHRWADIVARVRLAVAQRPGSDSLAPPELNDVLQVLGRPIVELPFEPMAISASDIRRRLAAGQSTQGLLDPAVAHYIAEHRLYRTGSFQTS